MPTNAEPCSHFGFTATGSLVQEIELYERLIDAIDEIPEGPNAETFFIMTNSKSFKAINVSHPITAFAYQLAVHCKDKFQEVNRPFTDDFVAILDMFRDVYCKILNVSTYEINRVIILKRLIHWLRYQKIPAPFYNEAGHYQFHPTWLLYETFNLCTSPTRSERVKGIKLFCQEAGYRGTMNSLCYMLEKMFVQALAKSHIQIPLENLNWPANALAASL